MPARQRNYAAEYAARRDRAQAGGWSSYRQERYWRARLTDAEVRRLAEEIGGPVEPDRPNALMSRKANAIVNPREGPRVGDWRVRLLRAAGEL